MLKEVLEHVEVTEEVRKEFEELNQGYIYSHGYGKTDVQLYADIKQHYNNREERRINNKCIEGDKLEIHSNNGHVFYKNAFIEEADYRETGFGYCEQPYIPFYDEVTHRESVSGGAFGSFNPDEVEYIGRCEKLIKVWGRCGACANGAITIKVEVNKYKLVIDRKYVAYCVERWADGYSDYKYNVKVWDKKSNREQVGAFRTMKGLKDCLKNLGLKISHNKLGCWGNTHEIIGDVDFQMLMSLKEYKELKGDRKEFAWLSNGEYTGAFLRDNTVYYCNPNVKDRPIYPYMHP